MGFPKFANFLFGIRVFVASLKDAAKKPVELAEGFEPPTR
jgi:hypothetical protein